MYKNKSNIKFLLAILISCIIVLSSCYYTNTNSESPSESSNPTNPLIISSDTTTQAPTDTQIISDKNITSDTTKAASTTQAPTKASESKTTTTTTKPASSSNEISIEESATQTTTTTSEKTIPVNTDLLQAYNLTQDQKSVCLQLIEAIRSNITSKVKLNKQITKAELSDLYYIVKNVMYYSANFPMKYSIYTNQKTGYVISVELDYTYSATQSQQMTTELKNEVNSIKKNIPTTSEFDKIKYIHDYIINNCIYYPGDLDNITNQNVFTAYGVLVEGSAVCEGYSKAFALLCDEVGIECKLVTGKSKNNGVSHMWNMVKCDGDWYHMDVTWDDPTLPNGSQTLVYYYFNVTTDRISQDHIIDDNKYLIVPIATATKSNYYVKMGIFAFDYEGEKGIIKNEVVKAISEGRTGVSIKLATQTVYNTTYENLFSDSSKELFVILKEATDEVGANQITNITYSYDDLGFVIDISFVK